MQPTRVRAPLSSPPPLPATRTQLGGAAAGPGQPPLPRPAPHAALRRRRARARVRRVGARPRGRGRARARALAKLRARFRRPRPPARGGRLTHTHPPPARAPPGLPRLSAAHQPRDPSTGAWQPGYHDRLYALTDRAIRGVCARARRQRPRGRACTRARAALRRRGHARTATQAPRQRVRRARAAPRPACAAACPRASEWVVVTNGDNAYAPAFMAALVDAGGPPGPGAPGAVAFDYYSRFQRPTGARARAWGAHGCARACAGGPAAARGCRRAAAPLRAGAVRLAPRSARERARPQARPARASPPAPPGRAASATSCAGATPTSRPPPTAGRASWGGGAATTAAAAATAAATPRAASPLPASTAAASATTARWRRGLSPQGGRCARAPARARRPPSGLRTPLQRRLYARQSVTQRGGASHEMRACPTIRRTRCAPLRQVAHVTDACLVEHAPSPQACAARGAVWDDRGAGSDATMGGRCISAARAAAALGEPGVEEVAVDVAHDTSAPRRDGGRAARRVAGALACSQRARSRPRACKPRHHPPHAPAPAQALASPTAP